jgi:hypothetical protein
MAQQVDDPIGQLVLQRRRIQKARSEVRFSEAIAQQQFQANWVLACIEYALIFLLL